MIVIVINISADDPKQEEEQNRMITEQAKKQKKCKVTRALILGECVFYIMVST